jgi:hypothetical protein
MLVYTQTSPQVRNIAKKITDIKSLNFYGEPVKVTIDQTNGFTWPWTWYLRNDENTSFPQLTDISDLSNTDSDILLIHSTNRMSADMTLPEGFSEGIPYPHRWWFPEDAYRHISLADYISGDSSLVAGLKYWFSRSGVVDKIGSEEGVLYYRQSLENSERLVEDLKYR